MTEHNPDIDALISDHIDGCIDADGSERLDAWLNANRDHQRRFLRIIMDHRTLLARHVADHHRPPKRRMATLQGRFAHTLMPVAVFAASILLGIWWLIASDWHRFRLVTKVVSRHELPHVTDALLADLISVGNTDKKTAVIGLPVFPGDLIHIGAGGHLALRFTDGTVMQFAGDTDAKFPESPANIAIDLVHGRVDAEVSPQPKNHPAIITTADAEVTVLGTVLAVTSRDGESMAEVSRGRISLLRTSDHASVGIAAGEYACSASAQPLVARSIGSSSGTTYQVGAGQHYASLDALPPLAPGDVVELQAGTYSGAFRWTSSGTTLRPITVRSAARGSPAIIDGTGIALGTGRIPHALFDIVGSRYIVDGIDFRHAHNGGTATGIICSHGANHTIIRNCRITDCDKGIDATDDDLLIERCDIAASGSPTNDGFCHGLLLSGDHAVVRECDIHDTQHGQGIKSRCHYLDIRACRVTDADDGELGIVDSGPGSTSDSHVVLIGNLLASKVGRHGNQQRFIEVGNDSGGNRQGTLFLLQNTFVAADPRIVFMSTTHSAMRTVAMNNVFVGSNRLALLGTGGLTGDCNWTSATATVPEASLTHTIATPDPGFINPSTRDFRLRPDSVCLRHGLAGAQYIDPHGLLQPVGDVTAPGVPGYVTNVNDPLHPNIGAYGTGHESP